MSKVDDNLKVGTLWIFPNFLLQMGEDKQSICFEFTVKKTISNKIKYWLFCKFFPFKIKRWDKLDES